MKKREAKDTWVPACLCQGFDWNIWKLLAQFSSVHLTGFTFSFQTRKWDPKNIKVTLPVSTMVAVIVRLIHYSSSGAQLHFTEHIHQKSQTDCIPNHKLFAFRTCCSYSQGLNNGHIRFCQNIPPLTLTFPLKCPMLLKFKVKRQSMQFGTQLSSWHLSVLSQHFSQCDGSSAVQRIVNHHFLAYYIMSLWGHYYYNNKYQVNWLTQKLVLAIKQNKPSNSWLSQ